VPGFLATRRLTLWPLAQTRFSATDFLTPFGLKHKQACQSGMGIVSSQFRYAAQAYNTDGPLSCTWFLDSSLSRLRVVQFSRLRFGRDSLPARAYRSYLNHFPCRTQRDDGIRCAISTTPSLVPPRGNLFQFLSLSNISPTDSHNIVNSHSNLVILAVLTFIKAAGYSI